MARRPAPGPLPLALLAGLAVAPALGAKGRQGLLAATAPSLLLPEESGDTHMPEFVNRIWRSIQAASEDGTRARRPKVLIGIKTAAKAEYRPRRERFRKAGCGEAYRKAGFAWAFFTGVPLEPGHDLAARGPGAPDTPLEQTEERSLLAESAEKGDMQFLPFRDQYMDLPNKLLGLLRYGYQDSKADYVMEHDDEFCADPDVIMGIIREHEAKKDGKELYAGHYLFKGTEYASMRGANGMVAPFFSGYGTLVSRGLLKRVISDDYAHSVLTGFYGTNSDDADLGKWVKYAEDKHGVKVDVVQKLDIIRELK